MMFLVPFVALRGLGGTRRSNYESPERHSQFLEREQTNSFRRGERVGIDGINILLISSDFKASFILCWIEGSTLH